MKYRVLMVFPVAALILFLTVYASIPGNDKKTGETNYQTAMRLIGHNLLLSAGDTKSRVLPIKQLANDKFQIYFENQLSLEPDSIFNIVTRTIKQYSLSDDYSTEVLECADNGIVYSFVMSQIDSNVIVPCLGRTVPKGCYYININFNSSDLHKSDRIYVWLGSVLLLMLLAYLVYSNIESKKKKAGSEKKTHPTVRPVLSIGEFLFYFEERQLQLNGEIIELTDKESKLLQILALAPNKTIDREQLQKEVWENEGVIVTRSLDVFISRLRKRLEKDPNVRLVNVHGKGYKLELPAS